MKNLKQNMWAIKCKHGFLLADKYKENCKYTICIKCDDKFHKLIKVVVIEKNWRKK